MRTLTACSFLNNVGEQPQSIDSPLQMKLISFLGLKNYMIDNFIFRRKQSKYAIRKQKNNNRLYMQDIYNPPTGYSHSVHILHTSSHSIPVLHLVPQYSRGTTNVIVYAHGNSSDMADSLSFIDRLSQHIHSQFVVFDYTGYGQSRVPEVGQQIIVKDLQIVIAWLTQTKKLSDIILWGFSLGTYPIVVNAVKYPVAGVILQCPIASVSCLFHTQLYPDMKFKEDHFANMNYITDIKSKLLILHSSADQIIPFSHAKLLYQKYLMKNGQSNIDFVEVGKIRHNSLHKYIVSPVQNSLQKQVFVFLTDIMYRDRSVSMHHNSTKSSIRLQKTERQNIHETNKFKSLKSMPQYKYNSRTTQIQSKQTQQDYKQMIYQQQLRKLRMQITQADIEQVQQLIYDQSKQQKNVKTNLMDANIGKNCFCLYQQKK